jgi:hypothetical protein
VVAVGFPLTPLTDLEPQWLLAIENADGHFMRYVERKDANGIFFKCPKCYDAKGRTTRGVHGIICWDATVPLKPDVWVGPGRWELVGDTYETLSLRAGSSSVRLTSGCEAHFFVDNGQVRDC